jgi:hypothetical protein
MNEYIDEFYARSYNVQTGPVTIGPGSVVQFELQCGTIIEREVTALDNDRILVQILHPYTGEYIRNREITPDQIIKVVQ